MCTSNSIDKTFNKVSWSLNSIIIFKFKESETICDNTIYHITVPKKYFIACRWSWPFIVYAALIVSSGLTIFLTTIYKSYVHCECSTEVKRLDNHKKWIMRLFHFLSQHLKSHDAYGHWTSTQIFKIIFVIYGILNELRLLW